jgi:hypothetical protein
MEATFLECLLHKPQKIESVDASLPSRDILRNPETYVPILHSGNVNFRVCQNETAGGK